jgi:hypothetical protein
MDGIMRYAYRRVRIAEKARVGVAAVNDGGLEEGDG